jgi:hypothetical protein
VAFFGILCDFVGAGDASAHNSSNLPLGMY